MAKSKKAKILRYTAIFEPAEEGGYTVTVPALPGCVTEGDTFEEAVKMAKDAVNGYLASLAKHGEFLPEKGKENFVGTIDISFPLKKIYPRVAV